MKKRIISICLMIVITMQIVACGKQGTISTQNTTQNTTENGIMSSSQVTSNTTADIQNQLSDQIASGVIIPKDDTDPSKKMIKANVATNVMIYGDTIYYNYSQSNSNVEIRYQNLNNIQGEGSELGADPLGTSSSGGLFDGVTEWTFFLVDECATNENGGIPVFIIVCRYRVAQSTQLTYVYRIFSYNSKDNTVKIIYEEAENIQWLALYGNYIFYVTNEGDKGYVIHRVGKDGSGYIEMENKDALSYSIQFIYEDKIYYTKGTKKLFSMNLDFSESEYLFEVMTLPSPFANDGYIYYMSNPTRMKEGGKYVYELCRRSIEDISKEETVLTDIAIGTHQNGVFYYYKYDSIDDTIYNDNVIYGYAVKTGENFVALKKYSIENGLTYSGWNEEYLVCRFSQNGESYFLIINIETGKEITMLYR